MAKEEYISRNTVLKILEEIIEGNIPVKPVEYGYWKLHKRTKLVPTGKIGIKEGYGFVVTESNLNKATQPLMKRITITRPQCSICGFWGYDESDITPYCPNCGAKMNGDE